MRLCVCVYVYICVHECTCVYTCACVCARTEVAAPHPLHVPLAVGAGPVVVAGGARARTHRRRRLQPGGQTNSLALL